MALGIPYAFQEYDATLKTMVAVCPRCKERIPLRKRKDWESFSGAEYAKHWEEKHKAEEAS